MIQWFKLYFKWSILMVLAPHTSKLCLRYMLPNHSKWIFLILAILSSMKVLTTIIKLSRLHLILKTHNLFHSSNMDTSKVLKTLLIFSQKLTPMLHSTNGNKWILQKDLKFTRLTMKTMSCYLSPSNSSIQLYKNIESIRRT